MPGTCCSFPRRTLAPRGWQQHHEPRPRSQGPARHGQAARRSPPFGGVRTVPAAWARPSHGVLELPFGSVAARRAALLLALSVLVAGTAAPLSAAMPRHGSGRGDRSRGHGGRRARDRGRAPWLLHHRHGPALSVGPLRLGDRPVPGCQHAAPAARRRVQGRRAQARRQRALPARARHARDRLREVLLRPEITGTCSAGTRSIVTPASSRRASRPTPPGSTTSPAGSASGISSRPAATTAARRRCAACTCTPATRRWEQGIARHREHDGDPDARAAASSRSRRPRSRARSSPAARRR